MEPTVPVFSSREEARKVGFLSSPAAHEGRPEVTVVESSMSWVFLAGPFAYKMKKPIRRPFLDYTSLAARQRCCEQEVTLNCRLAPDVYYGVVPVTETTGRLRLGGDGRMVEMLVKMRRLAPEDMLDARIARSAVSGEEVDRVALRLASFYAGLAPAEKEPADYVRRMRRYVVENREALRETAPPELLSAAEESCGQQLILLDEQSPLFHERVRAGRIIEGHGDLRPEHICLLEPPQIIDCLEFSRDLRLIDPADELSFLAIECQRLGGEHIGRSIRNRCLSAMRDVVPEPLLRFYMSYRACLRARMALWHTCDLPAWRNRAAEYLSLASAYAPATG